VPAGTPARDAPGASSAAAWPSTGGALSYCLGSGVNVSDARRHPHRAPDRAYSRTSAASDAQAGWRILMTNNFNSAASELFFPVNCQFPLVRVSSILR